MWENVQTIHNTAVPCATHARGENAMESEWGRLFTEKAVSELGLEKLSG